MNKINKKLQQWDDHKSRETMLRLEHLEKRLYNTYEPTLAPEPNFFKRIPLWLENVAGNTEDEKLMFNWVPDLFYVGPNEFNELYRVAYNGPIARWLIDILKIKLDDELASEKLITAVKETWFCPITDSMKINHFYHRNKIPAEWDFRPDWQSLAEFGSEEKIRTFCEGKIKRLVLLEDFVGSGSQMEKAVHFASKFKDILSILVVPLIVCPKGFDKGIELERRDGIKFKPVLILNKDGLIPKVTSGDDDTPTTKIRELADRTYKQVSGGISPNDKLKPYHPLGWRKTGAMVVMYTNVPNNSLPLIHWTSNEWVPLFPRHDRV